MDMGFLKMFLMYRNADNYTTNKKENPICVHEFNSRLHNKFYFNNFQFLAGFGVQITF